MSYRSEVYLSLSANGTKVFHDEIAKLSPKFQEETKTTLGYAKSGVVNDCQYYHWTNIKWYPMATCNLDGEVIEIGYCGVSAIENILSEKLEEGDYLFLVVGEDPSDVRTEGLFTDPRNAHIYTISGIEFN